MQKTRTTLKWSEMYKMDVAVPSEGKTVGQIEDFYFKEGTNVLSALLVRNRLQQEFSLPLWGIQTVEANRITIPNTQMLLRAKPPFPLGRTLFSRKVVNENGEQVGIIKEVILAIDPPTAMRIAAFDIIRDLNDRSTYPRGFTADSVMRYNDGTIMIQNQIARKLH